MIPKAIANYLCGDLKLKNEIAWMLSNVTSQGSREQIAYLIENGGLEILLQHIEIPDKNKARVALEALENLVNLVVDTEIDDIITKKCQMMNCIFIPFLFVYYFIIRTLEKIYFIFKVSEIVESAKEQFE